MAIMNRTTIGRWKDTAIMNGSSIGGYQRSSIDLGSPPAMNVHFTAFLVFRFPRKERVRRKKTIESVSMLIPGGRGPRQASAHTSLGFFTNSALWAELV